MIKFIGASLAFSAAVLASGMASASPDMQIEAQSVRADVATQTTRYSGDAEARIGSWTITADRIDVNSAAGELTATGDVTITDSVAGSVRHTNRISLKSSDWET